MLVVLFQNLKKLNHKFPCDLFDIYSTWSIKHNEWAFQGQFSNIHNTALQQDQNGIE